MRRTVGLLGIVLVGCYATHGRGDAGDGGAIPDAPVITDEGPNPDGPADATIDACASSDTRIRVRLIQVGTEPCLGPELTGSLDEYEAAVDVDGVRFHVDLCPGGDADCRCTIEVAGVGADVGDRLFLMDGAFRATVTDTSIVLRAAADGGEAGVYEDVLALYAEDSYLDHPFYAVEGITLASEEACRVRRGTSDPGRPCDDIGYAARVSIAPAAAGWPGWTAEGTALVTEGETVPVEGTFVTARVVRAHEVFCAPTGTPPPSAPAAAFVFWWYYPPAP